jgi:uncharacterized protein YndB with AHSA1/START domain
MTTTERDTSATADREIVISRIIHAPPDLVFEAFTDVQHLSRWWVAVEGGQQTLGSLAAYVDELVRKGAE